MRKMLTKVRVAPAIIITVLSWLMRLLAKSQRVTYVDPHGILEKGFCEPVIFAIWHNRLLLSVPLVPRCFRRRLCFLASRSRDGGYISDLLERFDMIPVRGSTGKKGISKGGAAALVELKKRLKEGLMVSLTPDGPRGPKYEVQNGIVWLASKTGCRIVPASYNSTRHLELGSWDSTQLPLPFSKGEYIFGEPISVAPKLDKEGMEEAKKRIRDAMMAITKLDHHSDGSDEVN